MKVCTLESQDLMALIRQVPSKPLISKLKKKKKIYKAKCIS